MFFAACLVEVFLPIGLIVYSVELLMREERFAALVFFLLALGWRWKKPVAEWGNHRFYELDEPIFSRRNA